MSAYLVQNIENQNSQKLYNIFNMSYIVNSPLEAEEQRWKQHIDKIATRIKLLPWLPTNRRPERCRVSTNGRSERSFIKLVTTGRNRVSTNGSLERSIIKLLTNRRTGRIRVSTNWCAGRSTIRVASNHQWNIALEVL